MRIHSKNRYSDKLTVTSGKKALALTVDLDLQRASQAIRKAREVLAEAQNAAMKEPTPEHMEAFGQGLKMLVESVFGEKQAESILDFYEGNGEALLDDLMPYILRKIAPRVTAYSAQRRRELERAARKAVRGRRG